jgi:hypothetical protein
MSRFARHVFFFVGCVCVLGILTAFGHQVFLMTLRSGMIERESATVVADQRFAIRSMNWDDGSLKVVFAHTLAGPAFGIDYAGRPGWALQCEFSDSLGNPLPEKIVIPFCHDPDFATGKMLEELTPFSIEPPTGAKQLSIRYGAGRWTTKRVAIPQRPYEWSGVWYRKKSSGP